MENQTDHGARQLDLIGQFEVLMSHILTHPKLRKREPGAAPADELYSPSKNLDEMFRVLAPGGIAIVTTTNKFRISLTGHNGEYKRRYFNWLPGLVKECFVFQHLHYDPRLANYSELPAVHWFSYASLCALGRQAGFAQFYSLLDLLDPSDPVIGKSKLKRWLLNKVKFNPWLRALALTQRGDTIIMRKK